MTGKHSFLDIRHFAKISALNGDQFEGPSGQRIGSRYDMSAAAPHPARS